MANGDECDILLGLYDSFDSIVCLGVLCAACGVLCLLIALFVACFVLMIDVVLLLLIWVVLVCFDCFWIVSC